MVWMVLSDAEHQAVKELNSISDRSAAIVGAAFLDNRIALKLSYLMKDDKTVREELLENSGPLATFSSRIRLGYMLGLYSEEVYKDLHIIRKIRNFFAHDLDKRDFQNDSISDQCRNLKVVDKRVIPKETSQDPKYAGIGTFMVMDEPASALSDPRKRYLYSVRLFVGSLTPLSRPTHPVFRPGI